MAIPAAWAERILGRLAVRYGAAFWRQYPDVDPDAVKADWAELLHGTSAESIGHALAHLPADKPPTAGQFAALCRQAPVAAVPALPPPDTRADPERVKRLVAEAAKPAPLRAGPQRVYDAIKARVAERGGKWSTAQAHQVRVMHNAGLIDASEQPFIQPREAA